MPKYFLKETPLSELEKMMMQQPGQRPKASGIKTGYDYTNADCDCKYCLKAEANKTEYQTPEICFEERLQVSLQGALS